MRDSVVKTPALLRDNTKNAFLGTMGPCGNDSLYQTYLYENELYHCNLAPTLSAWAAQDPDTEYCTWGYGELAPVSDSTDPMDYLPSDSENRMIDSLGGKTFEIMATNM
jgi:hypothetical protein